MSVRWLWKEEAIEVVLEHLGDMGVGCRVSPGRARVDEDRDEEEVPGSEGEEAGPGPPYAVFFLCLFPLFSFSLSYFHLFVC